MIQNPLAVLAILLGAIFFSLFMVNRYKWAERLSTIMWIIFTSALLSNIGLIPTEAPLYGTIIDFSVPFAVCVILFTVNLSDVRDAGKPILAAFALASLGTALGVAVASLGLEPYLSGILGPDSWKVAGPYTGTYIGGSLNFFALWTGLDVGNPDLLAAANAVDNLTLFPLFLLWMIVPSILAGRYAVNKKWAVRVDAVEASESPQKAPINPFHIATLVFLAVSVMAVSDWLKVALIDRYAPSIPSILIVTTLALILGQIRPIRELKGAWEVGDLAFWMFFAAVGALINFYQAVILSPILFLYVVVVMAVHFIFLYGSGWLLRMDLGVLTIASVATKAGPPLVVPVAESKGWRHLILPGIIIGMLGYAAGNYVGYGMAYVVRMLLGG